MKLLLASRNPAKLARLRAMVAGLDLEAVAPSGSDDPPEGEGDESVAANAAAKALAWTRHSGMPVLATDGGLEIPALGARWNPARTRRAAGPHADDRERAIHLLVLLDEAETDDRRARWREAAALATPEDGLLGVWETAGDWWQVARTFDNRNVPRGFWVPAIMQLEDGRRYGDLDPAERSALDGHWGRLAVPVRAALDRLVR